MHVKWAEGQCKPTAWVSQTSARRSHIFASMTCSGDIPFGITQRCRGGPDLCARKKARVWGAALWGDQEAEHICSKRLIFNRKSELFEVNLPGGSLIWRLQFLLLISIISCAYNNESIISIWLWVSASQTEQNLQMLSKMHTVASILHLIVCTCTVLLCYWCVHWCVTDVYTNLLQNWSLDFLSITCTSQHILRATQNSLNVITLFAWGLEYSLEMKGLLLLILICCKAQPEIQRFPSTVWLVPKSPCLEDFLYLFMQFIPTI